jgi:hypothetical protein
VLYCIDNETNESPEWGSYWARHIQAAARQAGVSVECTERWDSWDVTANEHRPTLDQPDVYSFVDLSQNNHQPSDRHWLAPQEVRRRILASGNVRPINSVKIYGANSGRYGSNRDGQERFWRNVFGGFASSRFHRPPSGLGLSETARAHIRSMRMLTERLDIFRCEPHNELLGNRSWNEAYCTASPGREYAVFFPDGGDVVLDVSEVGERALAVNWLDIRVCEWAGRRWEQVGPEGKVGLLTPREEGYWAAYVGTSD